MRPTNELRYFVRNVVSQHTGRAIMSETVLQQKWVQHHIPAGKKEAPYEWRDIPTEDEE